MLQDMILTPLNHPLWFVALFVWVVAWKGLALWRAARRGQTWWFVAFLIVNTLGILEILYIYVFSRDRAVSDEAQKV
jgi:hypothetical protein